MKEAAIGCVIVAAILLLGTVITGRDASEDTETAVHAVSMMYLDALAARRGQVVSSTLSNYAASMDAAVGLLTPHDLASIANLQAYQARSRRPCQRHARHQSKAGWISAEIHAEDGTSRCIEPLFRHEHLPWPYAEKMNLAVLEKIAPAL